MGIGQKIKDAIHHDSPSKTSTSYENDKPPGSFPSDTTGTKHNKMTDDRDYTTTGTTGTTGTTTGTTGTSGTTGSGLIGKHTTTTGTGHHSPTTNTHGGATGDLTGTGRTGHHATDSGIDVGHGPNHTRTGYDDPAGAHGPHGNRAENLADPRVDSDRDHRGAPGTGLTGSNVHTGPGVTGSNVHSGSGLTGSNAHTGTGLTRSNVRTGYDDPSGTHGPHGNRAGNLADPRVDSDRDHRGAPGAGLTGSNVHTGHGVTGSNTHTGPGLTGTNTHTGYDDRSNIRTGYDDPSGTHGPHNNRAANVADPRVDSDRDHRGAPIGANKDLPLRPNEQYGARGQGPEAVGGGTYNPMSTAGHHDPTSNVDRSIEGRDFTHTGHGGNVGSGVGGNQPQYGVHNPVQNPSLIGANTNDPYDTRMRDRDMGRDRTGHGIAGGVAGAGLGAAASQAAHRHHHDDLRDSGYVGGNTVGNQTTPVNTRGGVDDYPRSGSGGLTGNEPGVPKSSMLDLYNESPTNTHGVGAGSGLVGGRNVSPPLNQGSLASNSMSTSTGMGPDHYGPGHEGAKVMHTCNHCGRDNDISRYFKKEAVYRMN